MSLILYSIIFSSGLNSFSSSRPIDLTAILISSLSGTPVDRFCFLRKYLPASSIAESGIRPTSSEPVTRSPLFSALRQTSSKAKCTGVTVILVRFIESCAIPYSSIYHPIALTALRLPGIITGFPSLSLTILPVSGFPSLFTRPLSLTSNATALALLVEVVFRLILYATRKSLAPTAVAPVRALNSAGP